MACKFTVRRYVWIHETKPTLMVMGRSASGGEINGKFPMDADGLEMARLFFIGFEDYHNTVVINNCVYSVRDMLHLLGREISGIAGPTLSMALGVTPLVVNADGAD